MTKKLRPCPFCGHEPPHVSKVMGFAPWWYVGCPQCEATGPVAQTEARAGCLWNERRGDVPKGEKQHDKGSGP